MSPMSGDSAPRIEAPSLSPHQRAARGSARATHFHRPRDWIQIQFQGERSADLCTFGFAPRSWSWPGDVDAVTTWV